MEIDEEERLDIDSDHNMLTLYCNLQPMKKRLLNQGERRWKMRNADWEAYTRELNNKMNDISETTIQDKYLKIAEIIKNTAMKKIGLLRPRKRKLQNPWWNKEIAEARKKRKELNRSCKQKRKEADKNPELVTSYEEEWAKYQEQRNITKMLIGKAMMEHEKNVITSLRQKGMQGGKEWYRFLRNEKVSEDETIHKILVNGVEITEKTEMIKEIEAFWRDITTKKEDTEAINTNLISMKRCEDEYELKKLIRDIDITEVEKSLKDAKNNKAPGIDTIPYEMYKHGGKTTTRTLMELFNDVWEKEEIPEDWNVSKVKLQHKGGYKSKLLLKNYRPISLTITMGKLFANIISSRLVEWIERNEIIGEEQNGFRPDRRATDNIFTVNEIIDKKLKEKKKVYICFLDIEKAYDKVDREMMLAVLESIGLPRKIVNIIRKLYSNTYEPINL